MVQECQLPVRYQKLQGRSTRLDILAHTSGWKDV